MDMPECVNDGSGFNQEEEEEKEKECFRYDINQIPIWVLT